MRRQESAGAESRDSRAVAAADCTGRRAGASAKHTHTHTHTHLGLNALRDVIVVGHEPGQGGTALHRTSLRAPGPRPAALRRQHRADHRAVARAGTGAAYRPAVGPVRRRHKPLLLAGEHRVHPVSRGVGPPAVPAAARPTPRRRALAGHNRAGRRR